MSNVVTLNPAIGHSKLNGVDPKRIIWILDYDKTLADKLNPKNTDDAPLTSKHYQGMYAAAENSGRFIIMTARGELSLLGYLGQHIPAFGRLPNTTAATNSGHRWHPLDVPSAMATRIPVPGMTESRLDTVTAVISDLVTKLKSEFPDITADHREVCGAVVFQFDGGENNKRFLNFRERAYALKNELPADLREDVFYDPKYWMSKDGRIQQGYIDIKPTGMSKGATTPVLFKHYSEKICGEPFAIVAGDSSPDFEMMTALAPLVPAERRLFISVGDGLVGCDAKYAAEHNVEKLLDAVLTGNGKLTPVEQLHEFIAHVGRSSNAGRGSLPAINNG